MKVIIIYGPGAIKRLMMGAEAEVNALAFVNAGGAARRLHGSPLGDVGTLEDARLPPTVAEFDAVYPGQEDWYA